MCSFVLSFCQFRTSLIAIFLSSHSKYTKTLCKYLSKQIIFDSKSILEIIFQSIQFICVSIGFILGDQRSSSFCYVSFSNAKFCGIHSIVMFPMLYHSIAASTIYQWPVSISLPCKSPLYIHGTAWANDPRSTHQHIETSSDFFFSFDTPFTSHQFGYGSHLISASQHLRTLAGLFQKLSMYLVSSNLFIDCIFLIAFICNSNFFAS